MLQSQPANDPYRHLRQSANFLYVIIGRDGNFVYANPLYQQHFFENSDCFIGKDAAVALFPTVPQFDLICQECCEKKGSPVCWEASLSSTKSLSVSWEFMPCETDHANIHAVGFMRLIEAPAAVNNSSTTWNERYNAYEHSGEGLWMFETLVPVSITTPADEIIAFWRDHAYLAECNDTMAKMYGFEKAAELMNTPLYQLIDFNDQLWLQHLDSFIRNGFQLSSKETKEFDRYGNALYFLNSMQGVIENGVLKRVWGTQQNVTDGHHANEQVQYLARLVDTVSDIIISQDDDFNVVSWNKAAEETYGYTAAEMIGKKVREHLHFEYQDISRTQFFEMLERDDEWRGEAYVINRQGKPVTVLATIKKIKNHNGKTTGYVSVSKDITEKREAEELLRESEQFYRNMSYYSFDGIVMSDANGRITYCGPSVQKISGYEPFQLLGHHFLEFVHPDDRASAVEIFGKELDKQSVVDYILLRLRHAKGNWTWCTVRSHNLLDNPSFNSMVIYFTDDTKRKEAEDKLRESEQNFRDLIFNLKQGVILQDKNGMMTICNQAALDMLGLTEEQLLGKSSFDPSWNVVHENGERFEGNIHPVSVVLQTKRSVRDVVMGVYSPGNNERVWLLVNAEPVFNQEGSIQNVVCSFTDITEQKRLSGKLVEQEVQRQRLLTQATIDGQEKERLEIGKELHDNINQHLTTTRLYLEVAKEKASGEVLEMINLSYKTLSDIISEIRLLSQSLVPPTLGDIGLIESIQELCDSLRRAHKFNIDFLSKHFNEKGMASNLKLMLYRIAQEQVNNILRHAQAASIQIKLQADAEYIHLVIWDDGKGFDPQHCKKGLGFTNIVNRAALFNGMVDVESAPGKGCSVSVMIPWGESLFEK